MKMSDVRMPTQKRSIEKRNRIIEKGFELMCENGYYNTTIPDIAKNADVSVGIIYQYFNDKKDIFMEGVKNYSNNIMYPMINILETKEIKIKNLKSVIESMIDNFIKTHTITKKAHEELMAMSYLDEDVANIFKNSELEMTNKIVSLLENNNIHIVNAREKVHIAIGLIDNLCHEIVYHKHESFDYNQMKEEVMNIIVAMLK
jgi:AcrR family transcriptional regulator